MLILVVLNLVSVVFMNMTIVSGLLPAGVFNFKVMSCSITIFSSAFFYSCPAARVPTAFLVLPTQYTFSISLNSSSIYLMKTKMV